MTSIEKRLLANQSIIMTMLVGMAVRSGVDERKEHIQEVLRHAAAIADMINPKATP